MPPSTGSIVPVTKDDAGLSRNAAAAANSSGSPVAPQRDPRDGLRPRRLGVAGRGVELVDPLGPDASGQQAVDPDVARAELVGERLGRHGQAGPQPVGDGEVRRAGPHRAGEHERDRPRPLDRAGDRTGDPQPADEDRLEAASSRPRRGCPSRCRSAARRPRSGRRPDDPRCLGPPDTRRSAVSGSALSPTTATAFSPRSATASSRVSWLRPESTTRAPSATSRSAVARPRPRPPPVTTKTRSRQSEIHAADPRRSGQLRDSECRLGRRPPRTGSGRGRRRGRPRRAARRGCRAARCGRRRRRGSGRRCARSRAGGR